MVSTIIVTYNRDRFLKEAIDSVLQQTYFQKFPFDWELIIVDDGSTDDTRNLVDKYRKNQGNIRYYFIDHGGVSRARNFGLSQAGGEFIAFLDSDDLWLKDKIQIQLSYLKAFPEAQFCLTEEIWIRNGRRVNQARKHQKYSGWVLNKVLPLCLLSLSSAVFRRSLFEEVGWFDENLPVCEDYDLGLRIAVRYPYHFISSPQIIKRGGQADQLSRKYWGMDKWRIQALEKLLKEPLAPEQQELVKIEIQKKCEILISGFLKRGKEEEAQYYQKIKDKYKLD
ncbi:MAG: glycosyltransferase family 2 protein [Candidatus Saccharicenans sp.]|nr:MAG: glycosyl transferase [Candidatus Aminicenantes bacterium]HEK86479.1 glycosyltransferase family 2 protein [Candidatus Aminicenantes bacterium]